jgi:membrane protein DedA with SNARE-associated domain
LGRGSREGKKRKLELRQYLFRKQGGKVAFFGRFLAVLCAWAAFLAGTNRMPWAPFLLYNALDCTVAEATGVETEDKVSGKYIRHTK